MEAHARWLHQIVCFLSVMIMTSCQLVFLQISDFGMARDLEESNYYISQGGKIPVKWTAPEVNTEDSILIYDCMWLSYSLFF